MALVFGGAMRTPRDTRLLGDVNDREGRRVVESGVRINGKINSMIEVCLLV